MANDCYYRMRIAGKKENVKEFTRAMKGVDEYESCGVGRVFDCTIVDEFMLDESFVEYLEGDCAWSILTAMRDPSRENNVESLSKRLSLSVEAYSEEPGVGFAEHFGIINGEIIIDECVDYFECYLPDFEENISYYDDEFWNSELVKASGMSRENYESFVNTGGYITLGGYHNMEFSI